MIGWAELPRSPGHAFYDRLQAVLVGAGFDRFAEKERAEELVGVLLPEPRQQVGGLEVRPGLQPVARARRALRERVGARAPVASRFRLRAMRGPALAGLPGGAEPGEEVGEPAGGRRIGIPALGCQG